MHSKANESDPLIKFLPFEKFHLAPLRDVTVAAIKEAANLARTKYRDREELKLNTALNYIAHSLGFEGGFAGFKNESTSELLNFLSMHELKQRADLIRPRFEFPFVSLTPRQVADRLFCSGRPLPERIFTGYDLDGFELDDRYFRANPWKQHPQFNSFTLPYEVVMREVAATDKQSPGSGVVVLDAAVAACQFTIEPSIANMLGDQLVSEEGKDGQDFIFVPKLYRPESCSVEKFHQDESRHLDVAKIFRSWIFHRDEGWVKVLPYNQRLVFLKSPTGEYDFLFPKLRDEAFNHNPFHPYLKNQDVPKSHDTYHFRRWLYFKYTGWLEEEMHHSEITFYAKGGKTLEYPNVEAVLKQHLTLKGEYQQPREHAAPRDGFCPVFIDRQQLLVSNLITIAQFQDFMSVNPDYADYSRKSGKVDRWETVNSDENKALPAAVTWYDANAYAAWMSRTKQLPVRLLTEKEYLHIAPKVADAPTSAAGAEAGRLCRFHHPDGTPIEGHPPYMPEEDFQNLRFTFIAEAVRWKKSDVGIDFLVSPDFGEWLNEEATAINPQTLKSLCYPEIVASKGRFAATSTGKYKSMKVGFRLCYLGEILSAESPASTTATK